MAQTPTAVLIDDSKTTRACLRAYLTEIGYTVVAEGDVGELALPLYEKHRPTLITLDIVLPGIDGVAAAKQLLAKHPKAAVVMCSSLNARDKVMACVKAGVAHYLLKPINPERVKEVAQRILKQAEGAAAAQG